MTSIPHTPTPTATRKHRKPDPSRIYQVFLYEASSAGRRNAASRTANAFGVSDDTVRRIVARFEKVDDTPPEAQYQPAPGQVEYEVKRDQQARALASPTPLDMPQSVPTAAASVESEPQTAPQPIPDEMRPELMSSIPDVERELRHSLPLAIEQQPQTAVPQRRINELEAAPQTGTATLHSMRDDYVRHRGARRAATARLSFSAMDWGQLVAYAGPVLLLAWLLFEIVLSAAR